MIMCNLHKKMSHEHVIFVNTNHMIMCYDIGVGRKSPDKHLENIDAPERGADYWRREDTRRAAVGGQIQIPSCGERVGGDRGTASDRTGRKAASGKRI